MPSILEQFLQTQEDLTSDVDRYIEDLINEAGGNRDFAIKQIDREHKLSLGSNDQERAKFFETVADKLEERIGRIPYDYKIGTQRTQEDLARIEETTKRNKDRVLARLNEDEQVFRSQFGKESQQLREGQQEDLLARGILSGKRDSAQGLAGEEVRDLEQGLTETLQSFERAGRRTREDVETSAGDTLFEARRGAQRSLEDLKTVARRGGIDAQDRFSFGKEAEVRAFEARKRELERQRQKMREQAASRSLIQTGQIFQ